MRAKELIKLLENNGWRVVRQKGSHIQLKNDAVVELITIPDHGNKEVSIGVYNRVMKIAGLK